MNAALEQRLRLLDEALELGEGRVDGGALETARRARAHVAERRAHGDGLVVAALCGGTGTGKSSLFNALAGARLAPVGVRRPTTEEPAAWCAGGPEAAALLDWLGVRRRHTGAAPEGLVLVDLPDHDSVDVAHRATADRFVERVDVLVWVVDPVKYAHRGLHEEYLRRMAEHADVTLVVLNQSDRLSEADRDAVSGHLAKLLADEGLAGARLLVTSARTGEGVGYLRDELFGEARRRTAVAARMAADVRTAAGVLRDAVAGTPGRLDPPEAAAAVADAVGVAGAAEDAAAEYRRRAKAGTRPLVARWVAALLAALGRTVHGVRSLLPSGDPGEALAPPRVAPQSVRRAVLDVVERAAGELPADGRRRLRAAAPADSRALARRLAAAIDEVRLGPPGPQWWWRPVAVVVSVAEVAALAGLVWLAVLGVLAWLQLPAPPTPMVAGELAWPTALLLGGGLARVLLGLGRRRLVGAGAEAHRRRVAEQLRSAAVAVAEREVVAPLEAEFEAWRKLQTAVEDVWDGDTPGGLTGARAP